MRSPAVLAASVLSLCLGLYALRSSAEPVPISDCRMINNPGSYVLAGDLTASGNCLVVTMDGVTIDLGGFAITGAGSGNGILADPTFQSIAVRNGTISGFETGINLSDTQGIFGALRNSAVIEGVRVVGNRVGIQTAGIVTGNFAISNSNFGIIGSGRVSGNIATLNGGVGISITFGGSVVSRNVAVSNSDNGIEVFGGGSTVIGNAANQNGNAGMLVDCARNPPQTTASVVSSNTVVNNTKGNLILSGGFCQGTNASGP
jgi:hypothetical protein